MFPAREKIKLIICLLISYCLCMLVSGWRWIPHLAQGIWAQTFPSSVSVHLCSVSHQQSGHPSFLPPYSWAGHTAGIEATCFAWGLPCLIPGTLSTTKSDLVCGGGGWGRTTMTTMTMTMTTFLTPSCLSVCLSVGRFLSLTLSIAICLWPSLVVTWC